MEKSLGAVKQTLKHKPEPKLQRIIEITEELTKLTDPWTTQLMSLPQLSDGTPEVLFEDHTGSIGVYLGIEGRFNAVDSTYLYSIYECNPHTGHPQTALVWGYVPWLPHYAEPVAFRKYWVLESMKWQRRWDAKEFDDDMYDATTDFTEEFDRICDAILADSFFRLR